MEHEDIIEEADLSLTKSESQLLAMLLDLGIAEARFNKQDDTEDSLTNIGTHLRDAMRCHGWEV